MTRFDHNGYDDELLDVPQQGTEQAGTNPLLKLHQALRGRYVWAILTGVVFAAAGAFIAWKLPNVQPMYVSSGQIMVKPALDPILYPTTFNGLLPNYESYLETQSRLATAQRIIMRAMDIKRDTLTAQQQELQAQNDLDWSGVSRRWGDIDYNEQLARFTERLSVFHPPGTQLLVVTFRDSDPLLAAVAVKLVIAAYKEAYDVDLENYNRRLDILKNKERILQSNVKQTMETIKTMVGDYGTLEFLERTLDETQTDLIDSRRRLEAGEAAVSGMAESSRRRAEELLDQGRVDEADALLAPVLKVWPDLFPKEDTRAETLRARIAEKRVAGASTQTAPIQTYVELTPELVEHEDPQMASLVKRRTDARRAYEMLSKQYAPNTPTMRTARAEMDSVEKEIAERLEYLRERLKASPGSTALPGDVEAGKGQLTLAEATSRLTDLRARRDKLQHQVAQLQDRALKVKLQTESAETFRGELESIQGAKNKLEFEGVQSGRTVVISSGDTPTRPDKDRRKPAAAAGGMAGFGLAFAIFALIGLSDRRLRSIADARMSIEGSKRILGILPALPNDLADPTEVSAVAFAVHHIRTLLQLGGNGSRSSVFAVTSAAPQDGKTSLTTALGMSYATSGAKTLLIDSDIVGGGLTHRLAATVRPRLGSILVQKGIISSDQLDQGLAEAEQSGTRLGRVLVKLGFIKPTEKRQALAEQASGSMGFLDMLDGNPLSNCILKTSTPNLSVMSVGNLHTSHSGRISVDGVRRIIDEARKEFDVVIFDTGPLLGSLEAGIVAASVDEVIVAVARGQQISLLNQTFTRLKDLNAKVAGIVFNRAQYSDIERSGYSTSMMSQRSMPATAELVNGNGAATANGTGRLGPIAGALASTSRNEDDQ